MFSRRHHHHSAGDTESLKVVNIFLRLKIYTLPTWNWSYIIFFTNLITFAESNGWNYIKALKNVVSEIIFPSYSRIKTTSDFVTFFFFKRIPLVWKKREEDSRFSSQLQESSLELAMWPQDLLLKERNASEKNSKLISSLFSGGKACWSCISVLKASMALGILTEETQPLRRSQAH